MSDRDRHDHEERLQQVADRVPGVDDTAGNVYRFLRHAVRAAPIPAVPADFATQMEKLTRDFEEQALLETWTLRILLFVAAAGAFAGAWPGVTTAAGGLASQFAGAPWSLLFTAGVGMTLVWAVDRYAGKPTGVSS